ncbi:MAG: xanthine dehydrogenase family protein molybdopterin-binding subunit [Alphaproteobacteria bacterium]|nr:xanthine dehydrogenase family protein molybdopterin-binding subunit [Alphaproteobacteria bacterium]
MAKLGLESPSRRAFLGGTGALVVAVALPLKSLAQSGAAKVLAGEAGAQSFAPNAFVRIATDDTVTVLIKHIEFGQGPFTGLATLVAEELDADWAQIRAEHAPADATLYANAAFGPIQGTGGSTAMAVSYELMRKAGAAARVMLVAAAAKAWSVPPAEITVAKGVVAHEATGRSSGFGALAEAAAQEAPPAEPALKTPDRFVYIGKDMPKLDTGGKLDGSALFTLDVYRDGMLTAVVAHPDKLGAKVASVDETAARAVPGVVDVKTLGSGVAVYAETTFAALKGRRALAVAWDETGAETRSSAEIAAAAQEAARGRGALAREAGSVDEAFKGEGTILQAEYLFPYLAHAPMEPLDAVIARSEDGIEAWMGSQIQTLDQGTIAAVCGVEPAKVAIHTMLAGGSFGRRAQPTSHLAAEAAQAFMAAGGTRPVKLMWTREDDIRGGYYRPLMAHRLRGLVAPDGAILAWEQVIAGQSFLAGSPFEGMVQNGIDPTMVEGASDLHYAIPNLHVSVHTLPSPVTTLWWRSVGHTHTGYAVETFLDELLERGGKDPVEGRLALLAEEPRLAGVLSRAAEIAGWGRAPGEGRAFGVAAVHSFNSYVAQIAEVSIEGGVPRVHRVWCAVDCGLAVNPNVVAAQMEGGIGYGLGAMLFDEITLEAGGAVRQSNFHDYRSLRIGEMPEVEVAIVPSTENPTGVGEPGVPPIAPAVANAMRRLTGRTPRRLPVVAAV